SRKYSNSNVQPLACTVDSACELPRLPRPRARGSSHRGGQGFNPLSSTQARGQARSAPPTSAEKCTPRVPPMWSLRYDESPCPDGRQLTHARAPTDRGERRRRPLRRIIERANVS